MSGTKIANVRAALVEIVKNLVPGDVLHLVKYDSQASTVFTFGRRANSSRLTSLVESLSTRGCTDIVAGLVAGYETLLDKPESCEPGEVDVASLPRRIFLFSDGEITSGIRDADAVSRVAAAMHNEGDVHITTFGIGTDFNGELMRNIAEHGGGNFFFIQNADEVKKTVSVSFGVISSLLYTDAVLTVRGVNGTVLRTVYGFDDGVTKGASLNDFCPNDSRQILARFDVSGGGKIDVLRYSLTCKDKRGKPVVVEGTYGVHFVDENKPGQALVGLQMHVEGETSETTTDGDDAQIVREDPDAVVVSKAIHAATKADKECIEVAKTDVVKAAAMKKSAINSLKKMQARDKKGMIGLLVKRGEKSHAEMQRKGCSQKSIAHNLEYDMYTRKSLNCAGLV
jgi:hypothetical protein